MSSIAPGWMWLAFIGLTIFLLTFDLFVLGSRQVCHISLKKALLRSLMWIVLAACFLLLLRWYLIITHGRLIAHARSLEWVTGYVIEKSLSVDNLFVFFIILSDFGIPDEYHRRVLSYGLWGAVVMRLGFILLGSWAITQLYWLLYVFGAGLVVLGGRMLWTARQRSNSSYMQRLLRRIGPHCRVLNDHHTTHFVIRHGGLWYITPLLLALIGIEISDLIFAIDSIPAIFSITYDPFIIFTTNVFAILGLRDLYFVLLRLRRQFHFLRYGIAVILMVVGSVMLMEYWYKTPTWLVLSIIISTIILSIIVSLRRGHKAA